MIKFSTRSKARQFAAKGHRQVIDLGSDRTPGVGPKFSRWAVRVVAL